MRRGSPLLFLLARHKLTRDRPQTSSLLLSTVYAPVGVVDDYTTSVLRRGNTVCFASVQHFVGWRRSRGKQSRSRRREREPVVCNLANQPRNPKESQQTKKEMRRRKIAFSLLRAHVRIPPRRLSLKGKHPTTTMMSAASATATPGATFARAKALSSRANVASKPRSFATTVTRTKAVPTSIVAGKMTMYDKIMRDHVVDTSEDGTCLIYIDRHMVHEVTSPQAFEVRYVHVHRHGINAPCYIYFSPPKFYPLRQQYLCGDMDLALSPPPSPPASPLSLSLSLNLSLSDSTTHHLLFSPSP
jgi:hypothetical protein